MSTLTEAESDESSSTRSGHANPRLCLAAIEAAVAQLPAAEQAQLARWLQDRVDPDAGLELRPEVAKELDAARQELARGNVADWEQLKRPARPDAR